MWQCNNEHLENSFCVTSTLTLWGEFCRWGDVLLERVSSCPGEYQSWDAGQPVYLKSLRFLATILYCLCRVCLKRSCSLNSLLTTEQKWLYFHYIGCCRDCQSLGGIRYHESLFSISLVGISFSCRWSKTSFRAGCLALSTLLLSWELMPSNVGSIAANREKIWIFLFKQVYVLKFFLENDIFLNKILVRIQVLIRVLSEEVKIKPVMYPL